MHIAAVVGGSLLVTGFWWRTTRVYGYVRVGAARDRVAAPRIIIVVHDDALALALAEQS